MSQTGNSGSGLTADGSRNEASTIALTVLSLIGLTTAVTLLLHRYANWRKTPWYALLTTWINWFLAVSLVLLIPVDVSLSLHTTCIQKSSDGSCEEPWVHYSQDGLIIIWKMIYWITFFMTWAVIPVMQSYVLAGHFHPHQRFVRALKENVWLYGAAGLVGLILVIWVLAQGYFKPKDLIGIAMAASNAYGMLIVICLLGYGLVEFPRKFYRQSDRDSRIRYYQYQAYVYLEQFEQARIELEVTLKLIKKYDEKMKPEDPHRKYLATILSKVPYQYKDIVRGEGEVDTSYPKMVALHSRLINANHELGLTRCLYEELLQEAYELEDMMKAERSKTNEMDWGFKQRPQFMNTPLFKKLDWYWIVYIEPNMLRLLCAFFGLLSITVIWSETVFWIPTNVSIFSLLIHMDNLPYIIQWLFVFVPACYIAVCAYWTLFQLKIFKFYRLVHNQNSDANSILFSAYYLSRIIASMAYNFLLMMRTHNSAFVTVMGPMELTPLLGKKFFLYFPVVLILLAFGNLFNLYSKIFRAFAGLFSCCIKFDRFDFDDEFEDSRIDKGKLIIAQERDFKAKKMPLSIDQKGVNLLKGKLPKVEEPGQSKGFTSFFKWGRKKDTQSVELIDKGSRGSVPLEDV